MKPKLFAWTSWIPFLVSAVAEWGLDIDLPLTPALWLVMAAAVFFATNAPAALTTNSWTDGSGKWEIGANWEQGVPAPSDSINFLNKTIPVGITRTITIDQATVLSNNIPGNSCLTISNLTLAGTSTSLQVLLMTNAALATPLTIVSNLIINAHTFVVISNATLLVHVGPGTGMLSDDGGLTLYAGSLISTNFRTSFMIGDAGNGAMTVLGGTWQAWSADVGENAGSQGTLTIAGGTSTLGALAVGVEIGSAGAVWVTDGQLMTTNAGAVVGSLGSGRMTVSNGTWRTQYVNIGESPGSGGTLTVAGGTNTILDTSATGCVIGLGSTGVVWVTGGLLTATNTVTAIGFGSAGQMTVSNGTWLAHLAEVGYDPGSRGTLTIAGGTNTLSGRLDMGFSSGSTGTVWLTGGQLTVTNDDTFVGLSGIGQMVVSNGTWRTQGAGVGWFASSQGTLTVAGGTNILSPFSSIVGQSAGATGTVWLTGGQLVTTNGAAIAGSGVGKMTVSNGTWLTKGVTIGANGGSQGTLTIAGGQLTQTNASTLIGNSGVGQLIQTSGTMLPRDVRVAFNPGSQGTLTAAGGTGSVYSNLTIGDFPCTATGAVVVAGGSLFVTNSTVSAVLEVRTGTLTLNSGVLVVDTLVLTNACAHFIHTGGTLIINNLPPVLDPAGDVDADGLPNGWEQDHGLDPLDPFGNNGAAGDPDGDGFTNLQEFQAGTDPNDPNSALRITSVTLVGSNILIKWQTAPGKTNALESSPGTANGSYSNNFATIFTVTNTVGTTTNCLDVGAATNFPSLYYRVRLVP